MYYLGLLYEQGKFLPKDKKEAYRWYRKASDLGDLNAKRRLKILLKSHPELLAKDKNKQPSAGPGEGDAFQDQKITGEIESTSNASVENTVGVDENPNGSEIVEAISSNLQLKQFVCEQNSIVPSPSEIKEYTDLPLGECLDLKPKHRYTHCTFVEQDLSGLDLSYSDFLGVDFTKSNLSKTNFTGARLAQSNLTKANLTKANFSDAKLTKSIIAGGNLEGLVACRTDFSEAQINGSFLFQADLFQSDLTKTNFQGAFLVGANFNEANLFATQMQSTRIRGIQIETAKLDKANFNGALGIPEWLLPHLSKDGEMIKKYN